MARWRTTIRGRLLGGFALLFVIGLTTSSLATALLLNRYVYDRAETTLKDNATRISALVGSGPQLVEGRQLETLLGPPLGVIGLAADDAVLFSTGIVSGREDELIDDTDDLDEGEVTDGEHDTLALRIPTPGLTVHDSEDDPSLVAPAGIVLVIDANVDDSTIVRLFGQIALNAVAALLLLLVLATVVLRIGLRPLTEMAEAADAIADGSRDERLPVSDRHSETDLLAGAVNRAFDAQARAESRVRTFAADASHELRTPLATISGWLELHRQGGMPPQALDDAVNRIDDEVGRMRLLVEELGLLARLDTGRPLDSSPLDLTQLARSVVEDAQVIHPALDITLDAPPATPLAGDAPRLRQVLRNLVGNAVQHTPAGTSITLRVWVDDEQAHVAVADTGQGIPPGDLPRLFDRFWRAEASRNRAYGGSGLGLAIVQAIVQAHGGQARVSSEVGRGTTVTISLPRHGTPVQEG